MPTKAPSDLGYTFDSDATSLAEFKELIPYTKTESDRGKTDGGLIQVRINPDVRAWIERIVAEGISDGSLPYRTLSEFTRDAVFKWAKFVSEYVLGADTARRRYFSMQTQMIRLAEDLRDKQTIERVLADAVPTFDMWVRYRNAEPLYKELTRWVGVIKAQYTDEPYWAERWIRALLTSPVIIRGLRLLEHDDRYEDSQTVHTLQTWYDKYITGGG